MLSKTIVTSGVITSQEWTLQDWQRKFKNHEPYKEEMLDHQEDDGRVSEM
jgi:hypothetical protein